MVKRTWKLIQLLGEPYVLDIMAALREDPKRFVDLYEACPNEKTRTNKLRRLEKSKLVSTTVAKTNKGRRFINYILTSKGREVFDQLLKIEEEP
jgi:DNA-binding HxlR family transcriptional regulator